MLIESTTHPGAPDRASAFPPVRLDVVLASAEEALARAEEFLRQTPKTRIYTVTRLSLYTVAFDAIILERYPDQNQ